MLRNYSQNTFYQKRNFQIQFYKEFAQTYENINFILSYAQDDWYQNKPFSSVCAKLCHTTSMFTALNVDLQDGGTKFPHLLNHKGKHHVHIRHTAVLLSH